VKITVEITFSFKHELDGGYRSLELPSHATVLDALVLLGSRYAVFRERVFDSAGGKICRNINALVNGANVQLRDGFDTELGKGNRLTVLLPMGGANEA